MAKTCITILLSISLLIVFSGSSKNQVTRQGPDEMVISYVGNMGVLINTGETSVLIDGLHEFYDHAYLNTPPVEIEKIIQRQPPYTNTTLALFTHYHKDHFSSTLSSRFLEASASNRLAAPKQAIDLLPTSQVIDTWNRNNQVFTVPLTALSIHAYNIPHTGRNRHSTVQNVAYLLKTNQQSVLHIGDADTDVSVFRKLAVGKLDVMIVPIWFLMDEDGIRIIRDIIKPRAVIATHIAPKAEDSFNKYNIPGIETYFFTVINQALRIGVG